MINNNIVKGIAHGASYQPEKLNICLSAAENEDCKIVLNVSTPKLYRKIQRCLLANKSKTVVISYDKPAEPKEIHINIEDLAQVDII